MNATISLVNCSVTEHGAQYPVTKLYVRAGREIDGMYSLDLIQCPPPTKERYPKF